MNQVSNNKRIARNTAFLYVRMLFTTVLSLYAARLVLKNLGVEDYGIYNVVGGIVTFMGFLTSSMSSATQRYLSFYLGQEKIDKLQQTFSLLMTIFFVFCIVAFVLLECIGPLYISHYMKLPECRQAAAQYVFQFSLVTFLISTLSTPYRSMLIAYEKMDMYAFISVLEAVLNVGIVVAIGFVSFDRLILFALFQLIATALVNVFLAFYCKKKLEGSRYKYYWNKDYFKELLSYSGWNLFGSATGVMNFQGQAIVLNYFFGPVVNAAKAIADKVNSLVTQFSSNFYMAVAPQIIKSYAAGNIDYMRSLVVSSSRYSFLMMFVFSVPIFLVMEPVLGLWLGGEQVSYEMIKFSQFTIIYSLVNVLEQPITMAVRATGDIKKYQVNVGLFTLSFIPLCIVLFLTGVPSYYSMILLSIIYLIALFIRLHIVSPIIQVTIVDYIKQVLFPIVFVVLIDVIFILLINKVCGLGNNQWLLEGVISFCTTAFVCLMIGLKNTERKMLFNYIINRIRR